MSFVGRKITAFTKLLANLADKPALGSTALLKQYWDSSPEELRVAHNGLIDELVGVTPGSSGAEQIGSAPIAGAPGSTAYAIMQSIKNKLDSVSPVAGFYNVKDPSYGAKGDGTTDDRASIQIAVTAASATGGILYFPPGIYKISSNLTIPINVTLLFDNGAKISVDTGTTVTINGPIFAGLYQIFLGAGSIAGSMKIDRIYPQWWGAKGDGLADDTAAINGAIAAAQANNGGVVFFPPGIYAIFGTITTITKSGVYLKGSGKFSTFLQHRSDTADFIKIGNIALGSGGTVSGNGISELSISHTPTRTAGVSVFIENAQHVILENIHMQNAFVFAQLGSPTDQYSGGVKLSNVTGSLIGSGAGIDIKGGCNGIQLKSVELNNEYAGTAIRIVTSTRGMDTITVDNCLFQRFAYGLACNGSTGVIQNAFFTNVIFDGTQLQSLLFSPTGDAIYARFQFVNCWFTSNADDAVFIDATAVAKTESVVFSACRWITVYKRGVVINSQYPLDVSLDRCALSHCSTAGSALYPAIQVANNGKRFSITNSKIGVEGSITNTQSYGIILGTSCNLYMIANNDLTGNVTGAISDFGGAFTKKLVNNNLGFNPVGGVTPPAIPASNVAQANNYSHPVEVFLNGGTVTGITKNGNITGVTSGHFILFPGESLTITYSVAPSWTWFGI